MNPQQDLKLGLAVFAIAGLKLWFQRKKLLSHVQEPYAMKTIGSTNDFKNFKISEVNNPLNHPGKPGYANLNDAEKEVMNWIHAEEDDHKVTLVRYSNNTVNVDNLKNNHVQCPAIVQSGGNYYAYIYGMSPANVFEKHIIDINAKMTNPPYNKIKFPEKENTTKERELKSVMNDLVTSHGHISVSSKNRHRVFGVDKRSLIFKDDTAGTYKVIYQGRDGQYVDLDSNDPNFDPDLLAHCENLDDKEFSKETANKLIRTDNQELVDFLTTRAEKEHSVGSHPKLSNDEVADLLSENKHMMLTSAGGGLIASGIGKQALQSAMSSGSYAIMNSIRDGGKLKSAKGVKGAFAEAKSTLNKVLG